MRKPANRSAHREYRAALRKQMARSGRDLDLVEFDCFMLCMACGHLAEPAHGDPMRSEGSRAARANCPMCGTPSLVDLRHTPTLFSLSELETNEGSARWQRVKDLTGLLIVSAIYLAAATFVVSKGIDADLGMLAAGFILIPLTMLSMSLIVPLITKLNRGPARRRLPRRWRLPRTAASSRKRLRPRLQGTAQPTELLRAPLSGRPCVAYEVAVRDDASPNSSAGSWRLIEQNNAAFRVGALEVGRGQAMLKLPRELSSKGTLGHTSEAVQRFMRMRGLLDTEDVHVYETILVPDADCRVGHCDSTGAVQVFA